MIWKVVITRDRDLANYWKTGLTSFLHKLQCFFFIPLSSPPPVAFAAFHTSARLWAPVSIRLENWHACKHCYSIRLEKNTNELPRELRSLFGCNCYPRATGERECAHAWLLTLACTLEQDTEKAVINMISSVNTFKRKLQPRSLKLKKPWFGKLPEPGVRAGDTILSMRIASMSLWKTENIFYLSCSHKRSL